MAGLSLYHDGLALLDPPLLAPCSGSPPASDTEAELRRLFSQISGGFLKRPFGDVVSEILGFRLLSSSPPPPICADRSALLDRWFQKLCGGRGDGPYDRRALLCPDLKRRIRQLIEKLLNERIAGLEEGDASSLEARGAMRSSGSFERKRDPLSDMLMALRGVARDPCDQKAAGGFHEWKEGIFKARQALFLGMADVPNAEEFPYRKKQRTNQSLRGTSSSTAYLSLEKPHTEQSGRLGSQEIPQPTRRSKRTFGLLKLGESYLSRKRIPIGDFFQADVPEWTEPPIKRDLADDNEDLDDSRWLGTRIWPIEGDDRETSENVIGKGWPDSCTCSSPGSVDCIRFHVSTSRMHLKSDLGQAFFSWGFDGMGEEVSKSWTHDEQMRFDYLMKLNPASEDKSFWEPALKYFTSKSSRDIASYYFNVFVLRRMSKQIRMASGTADSDDDESSTNAHDDENNGKALQASYTRHSQRCLKKKS